MTATPKRSRSRRDRNRRARSAPSTTHHRQLRNPFEPQRILSDEHVADLHDTAVRFLQEHGLRVLLAEARDLYASAGASVGTSDDEQIVRIPGEVVAQAVADAPSEFEVVARNPDRNIRLGSTSTVFLPVAGPPFVSDLARGRRPGTLEDFENFTRLSQSFDVLHGIAPSVEAQDVPIDTRHLLTVRSAMILSDKVSFVYARGRRRVADGFKMLQILHGLDPESFAQTPVSWTNINTNTPRQIDVPMALAIIDFARAGQPCIMTPFTLSGAMAPVSLAGALLLQHIEVLAAVTLAQLAKPGAPVVYGAFTSNVDMRSGSPAFGTPEAIKGAVASGQLARHVGLPWRSSGSSTSNTEDAQGGYETLFNLGGALQGGANVVVHAAGWQEGGLCASYEKFVLDVEALQIIAESWQPIDMAPDELAYDAIAEVPPGGHFFGSEHTLARYETAFYDPMVFSRQNFEQWAEAGSPDARTRANQVWKQRLVDFEAPELDADVAAELDEFVERRTAEGGAPVD